MTIIGEALLKVRPDTTGFESEVTNKVGGTFKKVAGLATGIFAGVAVTGFLKGAIGEAEEARKVMAQTAAVIKSTGGAAGVSAGDVDKLSDSLSRQTGVDDEAIGGLQNLLLTFTNVKNKAGAGNDVFTQTTKIALDMAAALGTDATGSAIQLGKALNDPAKGLTALTRVGVTFTEQQKSQIKAMVASGDTLGAQKVILAELNKEFGGSAAAQAGGLAKLKVAFGNLQESVGKVLLPALSSVATFLADHLPGAIDATGRALRPIVIAFKALFAAFNDPDVTSNGLVGTFERIGSVARAVVDDIRYFGSILVNAFKAGDDFGATGIEGTFAKVGAAMRQVADLVRANLKPILVGLAAAFLIITSPVSAVIAGLVVLYARFGAVRTVVNAVVTFLVGTVVPAIVGFVKGIVTQFAALGSFVGTVWPQISEAVGHAVAAIKAIILPFVAAIVIAWRLWGDELLNIVRIVWSQIQAVIDVAVRVIRDVIVAVLAIINGDWGKAWDAIKDIPVAVFTYLIATIRNLLALIGQVISAALSVVSGAWSAAWNALSGIVTGAFGAIGRGVSSGIGSVVSLVTGLPAKIFAALSNLNARMLQIGVDAFESMKRGIESIIPKLLSMAAGLVSSLVKKLDPRHWFSTPEEHYRMLWSAAFDSIGEEARRALGPIQRATDAIVEAATVTVPSVDGLTWERRDIGGGYTQIVARRPNGTVIEEDQPGFDSNRMGIFGPGQAPATPAPATGGANTPPLVVQFLLNGKVLAEETVGDFAEALRRHAEVRT